MRARRTLQDIVSAMDGPASEGEWKLFYPFWKMEAGMTAIVRFLPDADENNHLGFLVENLAHELFVNGKRTKVACLSMYGEACPVNRPGF